MEGKFVDTVIGIPDPRSEIVVLRPPDGGPGLELSSFVSPEHVPGSPAPMSNELGLRNVSFEVDDLQATVDRLGEDGYGFLRRAAADGGAGDGYGLVGVIGKDDKIWGMPCGRGPEGIIVPRAARIG